MKKSTVIPLFLLLALMVFFGPAVFGGRILLPTDIIFEIDPLWQPLAAENYTGPSNPILADQVYQFFPWKIFKLESLIKRELPLWNPYTCAGMPFIGNAQSAVFDPFNILGYLLPLQVSFILSAIARLFAAGIFTFLFAQEIGLKTPGATLAMITFVFSGPLIVWVGYPHYAAIVWLPALLYTTEKVLTTDRPVNFALGSIAIGMQFLAGHPELSFQIMVTWVCYALWRTHCLRPYEPATWFRLAAMGIAGGLVAAIQLIPFITALLNSIAPYLKKEAGPSSLISWLSTLFLSWHSWPTAITTLLPKYFGIEAEDSYWYPYGNYVEHNAYAGLLPLALSLTLLFYVIKQKPSSPRSFTLFFAGLAAVCIGVALRLPIFNAINYLPLFNMAANGRLRLIYVFSIAILAGFSLDYANTLKGNSLWQRSMLRTLMFLCLFCIILISIAFTALVLFKEEIIQSGRDFMQNVWGTPSFQRPLDYYFSLVNERYEKKLALYSPANVVMYIPVLITLCWLSLYQWGRKHPLKASMWNWIVISLTLLDLFFVNLSFNPTTTPEQVFPSPDAIEFLQQDRDIFRVSGTNSILTPNSNMIFGLSDVRGYDTVVPKRYAEILDRMEGHYRSHFHILLTNAESPLLDLLNVKYILTDQKLSGQWELAYENTDPVRVYRNRDVLPRAFIVYRAKIVTGAAQSLEELLDPGFDFRHEVILEESPIDWLPPTEIPASEALVQITTYRPNQVGIKIHSATDGVMVLTDTYAPGWQAEVDGEPTSIYIANHAFRAIVVPKGTHQIIFVYRPLNFTVGAVISLLTIVVLIALALIKPPMWRSRKH